MNPYNELQKTMESVYLWNAITLEGTEGHGIVTGYIKKKVWRLLNRQGYYQISLDRVPQDQLRISLKNGDLIYILESITSLLDSGISIVEALEMMISDQRSIIVRYVFLKLKSDLHQGKSLEESFLELSPLFSNFFIAMIRLCEKSGKLRQGLHDLKAFYQHQENRHRELNRIIRYPKIIFSLLMLMSLGVIVFVVPMFGNIYALFKDELPILTKVMVRLSSFFHQNSLTIIFVILGMIAWGYLPLIRSFNPWVILSQQLQKLMQSKEDPFLYAHAMSLLLESGQSVNQATKQATECMSDKNRKHGLQVSHSLDSGLVFSEAFQSSRWFPRSFHRFIVPAEKTGLLKLGFLQIYTYIDRKREAQFEKWSRFIEPLLMLILGAVILTLLLSIYLPIFDLGNRLG